jgi:hypothetical protein
MVFVPPLFWELSALSARAVGLILWLVGITLITRRIWLIVDYIKSSDFSFHFLYLQSLSKPSDILAAWSSIWLKENIDRRDEIRLVEMFGERINKYFIESSE